MGVPIGGNHSSQTTRTRGARMSKITRRHRPRRWPQVPSAKPNHPGKESARLAGPLHLGTGTVRHAVLARPSRAHAPQYLPITALMKTLLPPFALMLAAWLAAYALVALVWLQFTPSHLMPALRRWPIPPQLHGAGPLPAASGLPTPQGWALALLVALLLAACGGYAWALRRASKIDVSALAGRRVETAPESGNAATKYRLHRKKRGHPAKHPQTLHQAMSAGAEGKMLWVILGAATLMGLVLTLLPALPSDDIFSYILYGRISVVYHANPLLAVPSQFTHDPFLPLVYWRDTRSVYGPGWLLVSNALTVLAQALGGSAAISVLLYRLFALACHLI